MRVGTQYLPRDSAFPLQGFSSLEPSTQLAAQLSPDLQNVIVQKGIISKRRGYVFLGGTLNASGAAEPVLALQEFESFTAVKTLIAFTTRKQYKWNGTSWDNITGAGGDDTTWTGDETNTVDVAVVAGKDSGGTYTKWIIATNGKDTPAYWDGTALTFKKFAPTGISNFTTCRTIRSFYDHLVLGNITLAVGGHNETALYWSDTQSLTDFAGVNADVAILTDVSGVIQQFEQLGDRLIVYGDNSIHSLTYVAGTTIYSFERILAETRLVSRRSIVNIGLAHLFLSQENVVLFDGTRLSRDLGDRIYRSFRDEFYASNRYMSFGFHDVSKRHVYFAYPINGNTSQFYQVEYDLTDPRAGLWVRTKYSHRPTCMGLFSRDTNLAYNSPQLAGVKYSGADFPYSQGSIKGAFPVRVFGSALGRVFLADDTVANDANGAVDSYWDSMDFTVPSAFQSQLGRWIELELDLKGWEVDVYVSVDEGGTYTFVQTLGLESTWTKFRIPIDFVGKTLRVRLRNTCEDSTFYLRWLRVFVRAGGPS